MFVVRMASGLLNRWLAKRNYALLYRIDGAGVGDTLVMTAWMRRAHEAYGLRFIVVSKFAAFFEHNPLVAHNIDFRSLGPLRKPLVKWLLRGSTLTTSTDERVFRFDYFGGRKVDRATFVRNASRPVSLIQLYAEHIPFKVNYAAAVPEIHLTAAEISLAKQKYLATLAKPFAVIRPMGFTGWTTNKEWLVDRYQAVMDALPHYEWLQVGDAADSLLSSAVDLRGKTDLRELAAIIKSARFLLCGEGMLNHISAAFGVPSFVIQSGYTPPEVAAYPSTHLICRSPPMHCAPCWIEGPCTVPGKPCTGDISAQQVIHAIQQFERNAPLAN
jgi:ADP-heptose:LPS heptosyltransferase